MDKQLVVYINRIFHDLTAKDYNSQHPEIFVRERDRIRKIVNIFKGRKFKNVLDIGCGTGFVYGMVKDELDFENFYMLDISYNMLRVAKSSYPYCIYVNSSALSMPFKDNSFDLIFLNSTLHHLPETETVMDEIRRILKYGGILVINHEPNVNFTKNAILWYQYRILMFIWQILRPIKTAKSIVARFRNIRNPVYDRINHRLVEMGIVDKPLRYEDISAYIDYLSPTAGYIRRGVGIDPYKLTVGFKILYFETYDYLGKFSDKVRNRFIEKYENFLKDLKMMVQDLLLF